MPIKAVEQMYHLRDAEVAALEMKAVSPTRWQIRCGV